MNLATSPCTAQSFDYLAGKNFFDNTTCHRLSAEVVLRCGDPSGKGTGGPSYTFADEYLPSPAGASPSAAAAPANNYPSGTVAMANPGANGSQFLIFYKDSPPPSPLYPIFGRVTRGLEVVEKVGALKTEGKATRATVAPGANVMIQSLTVGSRRAGPP